MNLSRRLSYLYSLFDKMSKNGIILLLMVILSLLLANSRYEQYYHDIMMTEVFPLFSYMGINLTILDWINLKFVYLTNYLNN